MKYNNIKTQLDEGEEKYLGNFDGDVNFIMGPISIYQFNAFADHGLCAVRLFQYIRTKQGLVYGSKAEFKVFGGGLSHSNLIGILRPHLTLLKTHLEYILKTSLVCSLSFIFILFLLIF